MAIHIKNGQPVIYVTNARYRRKLFVKDDLGMTLPQWMVQAKTFINRNNKATWPVLNPTLMKGAHHARRH